MTKKPTKPKAKYVTNRYGILNHVGGIWTPETFQTEGAAEGHIKLQQSLNPTWKLGRHRVVEVRLTITALR